MISDTNMRRAKDDLRELGQLVKNRRKACGYTQDTLVRGLAGLEIGISRSHLANIERGEYEISPPLLAALDSMLALEGVGYSESASHLPTKYNDNDIAAAGTLGRWTQFATDLASVDAGDLASAETGETDNYSPPSEVLDNRTLVVQECVRMLHHCASRLSDGGVIQIWGTVAVWLSEDVEEWRELLLTVLRLGWRVEQYFPQGRSDWLLKIGNLLACRRYRVGTFDRIPDAGALLISGESPAVLQLVGSASKQSGFVTTDRARCDATELSYHELAKLTEPLAKPILRNSIDTRSSAWSVSDLRKVEILTEKSELTTWSSYSLGWIPSSLIPPDIFARKVRERGDASGLEDVAENLLNMHKIRHEAVRTSVLIHPFRLIISYDAAQNFVTGGTFRSNSSSPVEYWRRFTPAERELVLLSLAELAHHPNFQLAFSHDGAANEAMMKNAFSVHGGNKGFVLLRTPARDGGRELEVDMFLESSNAVHAYGLYFERLFDKAISAMTDSCSHYLRTLLSQIPTNS